MLSVPKSVMTILVLTTCTAVVAQGQAPVVSVAIQTPGNGLVVDAPANVVLTATAGINRENWPIVRVEYYEGRRLLGSASTAPYTVQWANVTPGTYRITARALATNPGQGRQQAPTPNMPIWSGDSAPVTIKVNGPPAVTLTAPASGLAGTAPAAIALSANASDTDGTVTRVDFYANGTLVGSSGQPPYTRTWPNVAAGAYVMSAVATDNDGASSRSTAVNVRVNAPPAIAMTSPVANSVVNAPASVTLTASAQDSDGTVSRVEFYQGTSLVGTVSAPPYSVTLSNVPAGAYTYGARAYDNDGAATAAAAVALRVNGLPTVTLTSPAANAIHAPGSAVPLTAAASDADGNVRQVEFHVNGTRVGSATAAPYTYTWTPPASGVYTVTAIATDSDGASASSATVAMRVNALPQVALTAPGPNTVLNAPALVTLTADATDADGTISRVEFYANGALVGGSTQAPYSVSWSDVPPGTYMVTARATDSDGATVTSAGVPVRVNTYPTITLTSPSANASFRTPGPVTLSASAQDTDGTVSRVEFYAGTALVGTVNATPYTYTWSNVPAGSYSITARAVDDTGAGTVSAPVSITVASAEAQIYYIHTDHLGTPRLIADSAGQTVWQWNNDDSFGNNPPIEDPRNTGTPFTCNLRFPGQYFDRETNLHYNYFRDYDPAIGRYVQSDPIGLRGGVNTYAYSKGDPLNRIDRYGLLTCGPAKRWTRYLIPDNFYMPAVGVPVLMFSFGDCCRDHDDCYGVKCTRTKATCDDDFYRCMKVTCGTSNSSVMPICHVAARAYYEAVSTTQTAQQAFDEARLTCKRC